MRCASERNTPLYSWLATGCEANFTCKWYIHNKASSTRIRFRMKTYTFLCVLASRPHVNGVFGRLKRKIPKTLFKVERLENAGLLFSCGWRKRILSKTMTSCRHSAILLRMLSRQAVVFSNRFCVYVWTGWQVKTTSKTIDWTLKLLLRFHMKTYTCGQDFRKLSQTAPFLSTCPLLEMVQNFTICNIKENLSKTCGLLKSRSVKRLMVEMFLIALQVCKGVLSKYPLHLKHRVDHDLVIR